MRKVILIHLAICFLIGCGDNNSLNKRWVGSWSCAPYAAGLGNTPPFPFLENNTLRQVVRVSIGGDTLRMKFSNKTSETPVTMNSVNIAVSTGESSIDESSITPLTFDGSSSVTMDAFSSVMSDPVAFPLEPSARIAITIYYGQAATTADMTSHVASRTDSYIMTGDQSASPDFNGATITAHWFHINSIDVWEPDYSASVAVIGNSITDGYGLSGGLQNRWPDFFSQALLNNPGTKEIGVLNLGIGATTVAGSEPTSGVSRFQEDILEQSGVRWVIIFYGINDIGAGAPAETVIEAYQEMIAAAQSRGIKVYGVTLTPIKGSFYYSESVETIRTGINAWIRTPGNFDACIDFDKAIMDPEDPEKMLEIYSNDWLHPNAAGYRFLGESIDLELFTDNQ